jgi:hypothetical protein
MTARGIFNCVPEGPSTINVTSNIIELDGNRLLIWNDLFNGSDVSNERVTLTYQPYAGQTVLVMLNSGVMRPGVDFRVVGKYVYFNFTPVAADKIHVRYWTNEKQAPVIQTTGLIVGFGGQVAPVGGEWLAMDGATTVSMSLYPDLHTFLSLNLHLTVQGTNQGTGPYTLKHLPFTYYDGSQLLTGTNVIKT